MQDTNRATESVGHLEPYHFCEFCPVLLTSRNASIYLFTCEFLLGGTVASHCRVSKVLFFFLFFLQCGCCVVLGRVMCSRATLVSSCHCDCVLVIICQCLTVLPSLGLTCYAWFFNSDKTGLSAGRECLCSSGECALGCCDNLDVVCWISVLLMIPDLHDMSRIESLFSLF